MISPRPAALVPDLAAKAALLVLLAFAATHTDWSRFHDKAMVGRAAGYPLLLAILPVTWWLVARHRRRQGRRAPDYPWAASLLLTVPFVVDMAGNALDLYDSVTWFDDVCHFANWALLSAAVGLLLRGASFGDRPLPGWVVAGLCAGFGAVTAVGWELAEYLTFVPGGPEAAGAYRDTIGDLTLGLSGALLAGAALAWRDAWWIGGALPGRRRRRTRQWSR